jgi:hypothetical protein
LDWRIERFADLIVSHPGSPSSPRQASGADQGSIEFLDLAVLDLRVVAGSLIVILLWIYYSAQVVFFGAEFTKVYSKRFGSVMPYTDATVLRPR